MLIYRTQRNMRKKNLKLIHAGIMLFIVVLTVIALVAAFDSHNLASPPIPNMYSLHSWVGLTSVILFCCQVSFLKCFTYLGSKSTFSNIFISYSGLLDVSVSFFRVYIHRCEFLICQFIYSLALRVSSVQLHRVY